MTPDVMQSHADVITELPPDAVLLFAGTGYENQAFRVGEAAWGIQFHIEADAETLRLWAAGKGSAARLGPALDEAAANMAEVWREFAHRFVTLRPRLPLIGS
jgi:GMP synthase-like glutamine amidotransferase